MFKVTFLSVMVLLVVIHALQSTASSMAFRKALDDDGDEHGLLKRLLMKTRRELAKERDESVSSNEYKFLKENPDDYLSKNGEKNDDDKETRYIVCRPPLRRSGMGCKNPKKKTTPKPKQ